MRHVVRGASAVAVFVVSGCAIPSDDNPHRPGSRPDARFVIADWSPNGGDCPADAPPPGTSVAIAPIGHCLALDARGSADGNGGAILFHFSGPGMDVETPNPWMVIPRDERLSLPLGEPLAYTVTIRDRAGNAAVETASIVLDNSRPGVDVGLGRTLPEGGFPWKPGVDFEVTIPVSMSDPDGDPLRVCATRTGEAEICGDLNDAAIHLTLPTTRARYTYSVRAFDDVEHSLPVFVDVTIGAIPIWTRGGGPLSRIDPTWTALPGTLSWHGGAVLFDPLEDTTLVARALVGDVLELRPWPSGAPVDSLPIDTTAGAGSVGMVSTVHADPVRGRIWTASMEETLGQSVRFVAQAWNVSNGGTTVSTLVPATSRGPDYVPDFELGATEVIAALGSGGTLWIGRTQGDKLAGFDDTGAGWLCDIGDGSVSGIAKRPLVEETWATAYGIQSTATLLRLSRDCVLESFVLPAAVATGLAFADSNQLWVATSDRGVLLLDMAALLAGEPDEAVIAEFPEVLAGFQDGGEMRVDPSTGTFWVPTGAGTWEVSVAGTADLHAGYVIASGWDPEGRVLFSRGDRVAGYGQAPATDAVNATSNAAFNDAAALDWSSGGAWARVDVDTTFSTLVRVDRAGRTASAVGGYQADDGTPETLPYMFDISAGVDGRFLWARGDISAFTGDPLNVYAFEVADANGIALDPPRGRKITSVGNAEVDEIGAILPLAPVTETAGRLAWVLVQNEIVLLDAADPSYREMRYTHPTHQLSRGGRSLRSNDVCYTSYLVNNFPSATTLNLGRLLFGEIAPVYSFAVTGTAFPFAVAASDVEHDACWYSFTNAGTHTVRAYSASGVLLHQFNPGAYVSDMAAYSAHEVLVNESGTIRRVRFDPVTGGVVTANDVIVPGTLGQFVTP